MDITSTIEKAVAAITADKAKIAAFKNDPVSAVKKVLGTGFGDDVVQKVITAVKAKLAASDVADAVGKLGGLFGK